jgi:hypothetical protein
MLCSFLITGVQICRYGIEKGLLPEHPRAGPIDDVEE